MERLVVRMGRSQRLKLRDQVPGTAQSEIKFDAPLQRQQAAARQPPRGGLGERRLADVGEGIAAPEAERAAQRRRGLAIVTPASCSRSLLD